MAHKSYNFTNWYLVRKFANPWDTLSVDPSFHIYILSVSFLTIQESQEHIYWDFVMASSLLWVPSSLLIKSLLTAGLMWSVVLQKPYHNWISFGSIKEHNRFSWSHYKPWFKNLCSFYFVAQSFLACFPRWWKKRKNHGGQCMVHACRACNHFYSDFIGQNSVLCHN